jgi:hypothetical protein
MAGWVPFDADGWPAVAEVLPQPWPDAAAVFDLRWHADRGQVPGRPTLGRRWGWTDRAVRSLLAQPERWWDPAKGAAPTARKTEMSSPRPARVQPASSSDTGEPELPLENVQLVSSPRPADVHTRVDHPTPSPSQKTDVVDRALRVWNEEAVPAARQRGGRPANHSAKTKAIAGPLRSRLEEHGEAAVARVLRWYGSGTDSRAAFLRDGGHGLDTLLRPANFEKYLALVGGEAPPLLQQQRIVADLPPLVPALPPDSPPPRRRRTE